MELTSKTYYSRPLKDQRLTIIASQKDPTNRSELEEGITPFLVWHSSILYKMMRRRSAEPCTAICAMVFSS